MTIEGKLHKLYSEEFVSKGNTPFIKVILIIEKELEYYSRKNDNYYEKNGLIMFEYLCTNYVKKDAELPPDDFYLHLLEFKQEADRHENFIVEVDYTIDCREYNDKYFQSLKINKVKGRPAEIDPPVKDEYFVDEQEGFNKPGDDLPF